MANFCAKIAAPWVGVPLPGGMLVPSGRTSIFQALMSASGMFLPSSGVSATAATDPNASASVREKKSLCVDMLDLPFVVDAPGGDAVVVLVRERQGTGDRPRGLAARGHKVRTHRLRDAGLVPGAAEQSHGLAVPAPRHGEAREGLRVDRPLQRRLRPALAAVGGDHDLGDAASA